MILCHNSYQQITIKCAWFSFINNFMQISVAKEQTAYVGS